MATVRPDPADGRQRHRPREVSEPELGFQPRRAVRWLAPRVLLGTGAQHLLAGIFGIYSDKREVQGSLPATVHDHSGTDQLWLDYVADLGDGFDPTMSVASVLAADRIEPPGTEPLPRGKLLIMGGDQVYPAASVGAYADRTKGAYRAALPVPPPDRPTLFALPGNHDWYDGLTSFLRVFAQGRSFGGWATEQTRSYFAVALPGRWWLYAVDTQLDDYIDAPQLEYFRQASTRLADGDAVILCTPAPAWVSAGARGPTDGYDTIEFFQREIVRPRGASVRLMLSGDTHHYARYVERDGTAQRLTCGLGGAYLSGTHNLPDELELPAPRPRARQAAEPRRFDRVARYPSRRDSVRLSAGIFRAPLRNRGFWGLTGIAQTVMTVAVLYGLGQSAEPAATGAFEVLAAWWPAAVVAALLLLAGPAFARITEWRVTRAHTVAGLLHAAAHLALSVGWAFVVRWLYHDVLPKGSAGDWLILAVVAVGTPVVIGFLDAELVAAYLLVASRYGINVNEVFAGQSIEDHKGFLRLHIDTDGTLTIYPIKLARVCRRWRAHPDGAPTEPWLLPDDAPLRPELIEQPVRISRLP